MKNHANRRKGAATERFIVATLTHKGPATRLDLGIRCRFLASSTAIKHALERLLACGAITCTVLGTAKHPAWTYTLVESQQKGHAA